MGAGGRADGLRRLASVVVGAALLVGVATPAPWAGPGTAYAEAIETSGEVVGADVEGTLWLTFDPAGGPVSGRIEMTVQFDCRGKTRDEHHVLELTKGSVNGDRIVATAVYVERSGLPKEELSRCKSAYESYLTREDSRRLIGTVDAGGQRASGTLGEYRPTVSWQVGWQALAPSTDQSSDGGVSSASAGPLVEGASPDAPTEMAPAEAPMSH